MNVFASIHNWLSVFFAHLKYGSGGHLLRNTTSGHLSNGCPETPAECSTACEDNCVASYTVTLSGYTGDCCSTINGVAFTITRQAETGASACSYEGTHFIGDAWVLSSGFNACAGGLPEDCFSITNMVIGTNSALCGADQFGSFQLARVSGGGTDPNCCPPGTYTAANNDGSTHVCASQNATVVIS